MVFVKLKMARNYHAMRGTINYGGDLRGRRRRHQAGQRDRTQDQRASSEDLYP